MGARIVNQSRRESKCCLSAASKNTRWERVLWHKVT
jgi:hypothetical protein